MCGGMNGCYHIEHVQYRELIIHASYFENYNRWELYRVLRGPEVACGANHMQVYLGIQISVAVKGSR